MAAIRIAVPGGPVIPFWRHHEQLKNTGARNTDQQDPMRVVARERSEAHENLSRLDRGGAASQSGVEYTTRRIRSNDAEKWSTRSNASAVKSRLKGHQAHPGHPARSKERAGDAKAGSRPTTATKFGN